MEDELQWKTTFGGRRPPVETTFGGRQPLVEDDLQWKLLSKVGGGDLVGFLFSQM